MLPCRKKSSERQGAQAMSFGSAAKSGGLDLDLELKREIEVSKLLRACGGCLGAERR
jgi:hypothetical protein